MNIFLSHVNAQQRVSPVEKPPNKMDMMIHTMKVNQSFYQCLPNELMYTVVVAGGMKAMRGLDNIGLCLSRLISL